MRIVIVNSSKMADQNCWLIEFQEQYSDEEKVEGKVDRNIKLIIPLDTFEWRASEYNIDPSDIDTLIDMAICESYIPQEFYQSNDSLFKAPDIETARRAYVAEVARIKLLYRVSTRGKQSPLNYVRNEVQFNPGIMAIKGMETILFRHQTGAQELDPAVHTVMKRFMETIKFEGGEISNGN